MKRVTEEFLQETKAYLDETQKEILNAIIARKGDKGQAYAYIVGQAAISIAVLKYMLLNERSQASFQPHVQHAVACLITHAMVHLSDLYEVDNFKDDSNPLLQEFKSDVTALVDHMVRVL